MSAPLTVTTRTEALRRVISATVEGGGWQLSIWEEWADGEPRISDSDAAMRLGFKVLRQVRELIERTWAEGQRPKTRQAVREQAVGRTAPARSAPPPSSPVARPPRTLATCDPSRSTP